MPRFENLLAVLHGDKPDRETLFEFFLNQPLYERLADPEVVSDAAECKWGDVDPIVVSAFANAGYDYVTCYGSDMTFDFGEYDKQQTMSLNTTGVIHDHAGFENYDWPNPADYDYSRLECSRQLLPNGMKLVVFGPGGILENAITLVGFERLCMMIVDDPDLAKKVFDAIGQRLVHYYEICAAHKTVGALIANDDWGFKTQTMLAPDELRRYVFPWHRQIVDVIHAAGKPAILHSCGYAEQIMDDIIDGMGYDAKHSFEDAIEPVEKAYERWGQRIAILGGIDLDFVCRASHGEIQDRCRAMLQRAASRGGYALGTGNSIPEYVPDEKYFALIDTVRERRQQTVTHRSQLDRDRK